MDFIFILLGVLIILSLFDVGSFIYKKIGINHFAMSGLLLTLVVLLILPDIKIKNTTISIAGFVFPLIICIKFLFSLRSERRITAFIVSFLIVLISVLLYKLIDYSAFEYALFKPYMILSVVLGLITYLICKRSSISYISLFFGLNVGQIMFYQIKYSSERVLMLGSRELLTALILAFLTSIICECIYGAYVKRKKVKYEKKLERLKTIEK